MQRRLFVLTLSLCTALVLRPSHAAEDFTPQVGQPGKDVIWVPTPDALVERMLDMARQHLRTI